MMPNPCGVAGTLESRFTALRVPRAGVGAAPSAIWASVLSMGPMRARLANACMRGLWWAAVVVAAAWLVGRVFGDHWAWSQWLFWIPAFAVTPVALGAWLATRLRRADGARLPAAIALGSLAIGAWECFGVGPAQTDDPRAVRVMQWNTDWPSGDDPRSAAFLAAHPVDLLLISNRGGITSPDQVRAWAGEDARVVGAGPFALVSRLPVTEARQVAVGGNGRQLWWVARFEVAPPAWHGRVLRIAMVDLPSRPTIPKARIADGLREACEQGGLGEVDLVAGDFNATDGSVIVSRCFPDHLDALTQAGRGWLATWPRRFPLWKIDHMLVGADIRVASARVLDPGASRHRATVADIVPTDR